MWRKRHLICGDCGAYYGSKVWHSNTKYRKIIYRCNSKYSGEKCATPSLDEETLQNVFVRAIIDKQKRHLILRC